MAKGLKTGGRKKGIPNKRTEALVAAVESSGLTPLDYMLSVLRDPERDYDVRLEAAKSAAPYVHPKLANIELSGNKDKPLEVRVVRFDGQSSGTGIPPRSSMLNAAKTMAGGLEQKEHRPSPGMERAVDSRKP